MPNAFARSRRVRERDGEQRQRRRSEQRAERALQRPGDHQDLEGRRQPAQERRGGEADQAGDEGPLAPEEVADLPAHQQQAAERERVGGDDPLAVLRREPKVALRRRQRDVDDGRVENDHELRHPDEREHGPAVGLGGGRRGGRHRSRVQSRILGPSGRRPRRRPSRRSLGERTMARAPEARSPAIQASPQTTEASRVQGFSLHGARGTRTPDLLGAIQALSQLSYSPGWAAKCSPRSGGARTGGRRAATLLREAMSFRNRLTLFFVLIVVVPMVAVGVRALPAHRRQRERQGRRAAGREQPRGRQPVPSRTAIDAAGAARRIGGDVALAQALRDDDRAALTRAPERAAREQAARAHRHRARRAGRSPTSAARPRSFPAARDLVDERRRSSAHCRSPSQDAPRLRRACVARVTGLDAVVRAVGGPVLAATVPGVDPARIPDEQRRARGRRQATTTRPRSRARLPRRARPQVAVLAPDGEESDAVANGRLLAAASCVGFFVLAFTFALAGLALAAAPDRAPSCRPRAAWARRLHGEVPDRRPRRVRRARRGVQQDVAPARGAPGGARPGARAPAGGDAPHRRDVRLEPRPRGAAGDRRQDRGRRRRRRGRARLACARDASAPLEQVAHAGTRRRPRGGDPRRRGASVLETGEPCEADVDGVAALVAPAAPRRRAARPRLRRRLGRARERAVHAGRARAVPLPRRAGRGVDRERRPARDASSARR